MMDAEYHTDSNLFYGHLMIESEESAMNGIERAAQNAVPENGGSLKPLERATGTAPVLASPASLAWVTAAGVLYVAGNMVTDLVGQESAVNSNGGGLKGKSGAELLNIRTAAIRS